MKPVIRVYSGRPGCMCGCKGKYYEPADKGFARVLKNLLKQPEITEEDDMMYTEDDHRVYVAYFS